MIATGVVMKRPLAFSQTSSPHSQRGIATVLIVVLIGVALTATAMGIMHSMRSSQEKHVAVHAATNAQIGAWAGVEAFRLYLDSQGVGGLADGGTYPISLDGYGTMTAKDIKITDTATGHRVGATIVNVQDAAHSSAAVGVMYEITSTAGEYQLSGPLNFNDDLMLTSRLVLDNPMSLNVKGDVTINNANITNLLGINTTGSVTVSSNNAINLGTIHANGDVKLSGTDAFAPEIKTQGEVKLEGSARAPLISANRKVVHNANSNTTSMRSRSDIEIGNSSGNHEYVNSGGKATIESAYSRTITTLSSVGRINNKSAAATLTNVQGEENLDCLSAWNSFTNIGINGTLGENCTHLREPPDGQTVAESAGISVPVMPPVAPFRMPTLAVDVYPFRGEANYWVSYEDSKIKVRVSNINGLDDGVYYVGKGYKICESLDANGDCTSDKYMCLGQAVHEACITYSLKSFTVADDAGAAISYQNLPLGTHPSKGYFEIQGAGIAPGIWWIDGSLVLSNGYNNGTILVTGNIATSNHYRGAAVNYGSEPVVYSHSVRDPNLRTTPYQEICEVVGTGLDHDEVRHHLAAYKTRFRHQFPTNLCNTEDGIYIPHTLGNIALAAGGIRPANDEILGGDGDGETYSGGDISIKSNSNVFGIALAGGYLSLRNNVAIMGYISASVQGPQRGPNAVKNVADGDIKIYTDSETEWYSPSTVPWMGQDPCQIGCGTSLPGGGAKLLWSRYL
jgi:hypothetical protein